MTGDEMGVHDQLLRDEVVERHLARKRDAFIEEYGLSGMPAFIWQSLPLDAVVVDVSKVDIQHALRQGKGSESDDAWWYGFRSGNLPSPVFDGIALSIRVDAQWATQLHVDGHLIASIWSFPSVLRQDRAEQMVLPTYFAEAFRDFGGLAQGCYKAADYAGKYTLTCTLEQADRLALGGARDNIIAPPTKRKTLRWPLLQVSNSEEANAAAYQMGVQLMRAYGKSMKPW